MPRCYNCDVSVCSWESSIYRNTGLVYIHSIDSPEIPYFDGAIFTSRHQPLPLTVKRDRSDIRSMTFKGNDLCFSHEKGGRVKTIEDPITGVDEELEISYMFTFL